MFAPVKCISVRSVLLSLFAASTSLAFDADNDGNIDLSDFEGFHLCFTGPDAPDLAAECWVFDVDGEGDVDQTDLASFQNCFTGPGAIADAGCAALRVRIVAPIHVLIEYPTMVRVSLSNVRGAPLVFWDVVAGDATVQNPTSVNAMLTAHSTDPVILRVTASDTGSTWMAQDSITLSVVTEPMSPEVIIVALPDVTVDEDTALVLEAFAFDPLGLPIAELAWVQTGGPLLAQPFSNPTSAATNFNTCCPGVYDVAAVARNSLGQLGQADETLTIVDVPGPGTVRVDAGPDRQLIPNATDFWPSVSFGSGAILYSGTATVPDLAANATDTLFPDDELAISWEVSGVPTGVDPDDVLLLSPSDHSTGFLILPSFASASATLAESGQAGAVTDIVVPGDYRFTVTATNPYNDMATDDVVYNIAPRFTMVPTAVGTPHGLSLGNGSLLRRVIRPNAQADQALRLLPRVAGTLVFSLVDAGDATNAAALASGAGFYGAFSTDALAPQFLENVGIAPADPIMVVDEMLTLMSTDRGAYLLQARLAAGAASVGSAFLGEDQTATPGDNDVLDAGDLPAVIHVSPELTGAVDSRPPFVGSSLQHFGAVNSTDSTSGALLRTEFHGARAAAGGNDFWDGEVIIECDVNNDGWPEVVTADGNVISILRGLSDDPTNPSSSPLNNSINNGGVLSENSAGLPGTVDSLALTDANMAGTVPNVTQITAMACGDLDNDSKTDLVVGEGGYNGGVGIGAEGRVLVFYGQGFSAFAANPFTTDGSIGGILAQPRVITRPDGIVAGIIGRDDHFGHALAVCNFNNDGFDDLIVGCPGGGQTITAVATGILVNGAAQVGQTLTVDTVNATFVFEPGDIAIVDSNDTAQSLVRRVTAVPNATTINFDLPIGAAPADNENVDKIVGMSGAVFGFNGNLIRFPNNTIVDDGGFGANFRIIPTSSVSGDMLGASVVCGDVSGDGIDDIVFSAPARKDSGQSAALHVAAGAVFITNGRASGLSGNVNTIDRIFEGNAAHLGFGRALAVGNFNAAMGVDIAVSACVGGGATPSLGTAGTGRVYILRSNQPNIQTAADGTSALSNVPQVSGVGADSNLGARLAAHDFNGDGADDLLISAPSVTDSNQRVYLIHGAATIPTSLLFAVTISNGASPAGGWLNQPTGTMLTGADSPLDVRAVLYFADGLGFADVNGDRIRDLAFQGDAAVASPAYAVMGAE